MVLGKRAAENPGLLCPRCHRHDLRVRARSASVGGGEYPKDVAGRAMSLYRIKRRGINHPVQQWARERNVKAGTLYPATCQISDKPFGKKGKTVPYDDKKLRELLLLNGNNYAVFKFATRIGGWLFNSVSNKHLIPKLKGLLWWQNNYVPFPLPKGKKAFAEKIYCDGNQIVVDKVLGSWVHVDFLGKC